MLFKVVFLTSRPSFLILTPICVFLGYSAALNNQYTIDSLLLTLILIGALCAHISVNMLNEYHDFRSGLDANTIKTPFSGGSGALPAYPDMAPFVLMIGLMTLLITVLIGLYFISVRGMQLLPIGLVGVILILTYTQWLNRYPLICLIAPGTGFGLLMVVGTHLVLTGQLSPLTWLLSFVPFFLVNNLLLLNQYPDIAADSSVGRNTFPIAFGIHRSNLVYLLSTLCTCLLIIISIFNGAFPVLAAIALVPMVLAFYSIYGALKYGSELADFPQYLASNVAATLLTPLLLGISIIIA